MALKPPTRSTATEAQADALANKLADRVYGEEKPEEVIARTTISLPKSLLVQMEDLTISNRRAGIDPKNVSALVRMLAEQYLQNK